MNSLYERLEDNFSPSAAGRNVRLRPFFCLTFHFCSFIDVNIKSAPCTAICRHDASLFIPDFET